MASIKERIQEVIKASMKSGDKDTLTYARNVHAAVRKKEIDDRVDLDDAAIEKLLMGMVKQRRESIEQFKAGGRSDLVQKEEAELAFLMKYLPQQMSEDEIRKAVREAIAESQAAGPKDMGKVMKLVVPKTQGRADGKVVSQLVKEELEAASK